MYNSIGLSSLQESSQVCVYAQLTLLSRLLRFHQVCNYHGHQDLHSVLSLSLLLSHTHTHARTHTQVGAITIKLIWFIFFLFLLPQS